MDKIAVIGDRESVLVFRVMGVFVCTPDDKEDARRMVDKLAREGYGVIFITEQIAVDIPETIMRYRNEFKPTVILIPNQQGSLGIGMNDIKKNVEKAVGRNIFK